MKTLLILFVASFLFSSQIISQPFIESGSQAGLNYIYTGIDYQEVGSGVIVVDVNNDGWDDFFQAGGVFPSRLWINNKGKFNDQTYNYKLGFLDSFFVQGGSSGDFDNDGYEDIFICNMGTGMRHGDDKNGVLLHNIKGEYFMPIFDSVFSPPGNITSCAWGDYNNDGYLDLYTTNYIMKMKIFSDSNEKGKGYEPTCLPNRFYQNNNGEYFTKVDKILKLDDIGCGLATSFSDIDNDGDMDILLANDFGEWNHYGNLIFRNNFPEKSFTAISKLNGFYKEIYGMGIGPGDFDNDGDLDYYITNIGKNYFFKNTNGQFEDVAKQLNLENTNVIDSLNGAAWSCLFLDVENDGDLDLYITKGNLLNLVPPVAIEQPNILYLNNGNGTFTDISSKSGLNDILSHRGAAVLDYDHDGDLDILSSVIKMQWSKFWGRDQKLKLFKNNNKSKNNWIGIKLIGTNKTNRSCLGCNAVIESGGIHQIKEVDGGSGHSSQNTKTLYFGLGKQKIVEKITIHFLGSKTIVLNNLKPGFVYEVNEEGNVIKLY